MKSLKCDLTKLEILHTSSGLYIFVCLLIVQTHPIYKTIDDFLRYLITHFKLNTLIFAGSLMVFPSPLDKLTYATNAFHSCPDFSMKIINDI